MSENNEINHDTNEVNSKILALTVIGASLFILLAVIFSYFIYIGIYSLEMDSKEITSDSKFLLEVEAYENKKLTTYDWVDKKKGIVQVPVETVFDKVINKYK